MRNGRPCVFSDHTSLPERSYSATLQPPYSAVIVLPLRSRTARAGDPWAAHSHTVLPDGSTSISFSPCDRAASQRPLGSSSTPPHAVMPPTCTLRSSLPLAGSSSTISPPLWLPHSRTWPLRSLRAYQMLPPSRCR